MAGIIKDLLNDVRTELGLPVFGKKHVEMAKCMLPNVGAFTAATAIFLVYFTDWKVIVGNMPFYNTKFKEDE